MKAWALLGFFFKSENVRPTTLLAFFEEVNISKRTLGNEHLAFCQLHHPMEHRKGRVYGGGADTCAKRFSLKSSITSPVMSESFTFPKEATRLWTDDLYRFWVVGC